jgi:hypothetical protein
MAAFFPSASGVTHAGELVLRATVSAYLGRYRGQTRLHTESDLQVFLRWCTNQDLDPLTAVRADLERYLRWLQDVRRYQPSTVCRRLSVVVGFYRVCVIDEILPHSPADYVRRPTVPAESPTLGLGHLQFEGLISTARLSTNDNDFALVLLHAFREAAQILEDNRSFSEPRLALIAATPTLRERDLAKGAAMALSVAEALRRRGVDDRLADLAAHTGWATFHHAAQNWIDDPTPGLQTHLTRAFADLNTLFRAIRPPN